MYRHAYMQRHLQLYLVATYMCRHAHCPWLAFYLHMGDSRMYQFTRVVQLFFQPLKSSHAQSTL